VGLSDLGKLDIGDWLSLAVVSVGAGMGSAMAWFKASNKKRDEAIEGVKKDVEDCKKIIAAHTTLLAVSQACQENINEKLGEIKESVQNTAIQGAHSVNTQIAALANDIQKMGAKLRRHDTD
jgi:hypothetical protein